MLVAIFQLAYLGIGAAVIIRVARLIVQRPGFYLIGLGWALLALSFGAVPDDVLQALQWLCVRVGCLLLILGGLHLLDLRLSRRPA